MKLNANCVLMRARVYTLVNLHGTYTLAARSTFRSTGRASIPLSLLSTKSPQWTGARVQGKGCNKNQGLSLQTGEGGSIDKKE